MKIIIFFGFLTTILIAIAGLMVSESNHTDVHRNVVTEWIVTPFGYPYPYKLSFVAQYRFVHQIGEFLIRRDNRQNIIGGLAKSWEISADRRKVTFLLRSELYSAEEVAQSLRRLVRSGQTTHSNFAAQTSPELIIAVNANTLSIETYGDAGAILSPLTMADAVIVPDDQWIKVPGIDAPQVDWRLTRGPYIYSSGKFPVEEDAPVVFRPNPKHYFYSADQVNWKLVYKPIEKIPNLAAFDSMLATQASFCTIRYWDMFKLFSSGKSTSEYYETRPNGVAFLAPNPKSAVLRNVRARTTLLKRLNHAEIPLNNPSSRADQIPQPGLSGRLSDPEFIELKAKIESEPDYEFYKPLVVALPDGPSENQLWVSEIAEALKVPIEFRKTSSNPMNSDWINGGSDLMMASIGMSDSDPISGATFLFSKLGANLDLSDGSIMKLLNDAKETADRSLITAAVQRAFKLAYEKAALFPVSYTVNRHYVSRNVHLNITDPFSESVRIWEVRVSP